MGTTVLITDIRKNRSHHGTGFVVFNDNEGGSFIVTCRHVLEACIGTEPFQKIIEENSWKKIVLVDGQDADLIAFGTDKKDLAVIYVKGLEKTIPFELCMNPLILKGKNIPFELECFDTNELKSLKDIRGLIVKRISRGVTHFRLKPNIDSSSIEGGNSGSAIVTLGTNKVIGVLVSEEDKEGVGFAISIEYLKDIWKEMPQSLFVQCVFSTYTIQSLFEVKTKIENVFSSILKYLGLFVIVSFLIYFWIVKKSEEYNILGENAYHSKNYRLAINYYNESIEWDEDNYKAYSNLGLAYKKIGEIELALFNNNKAIELAKEENDKEWQGNSYFNNAQIYEKQKKWEKALDNYEDALAVKEHPAYRKGIKAMKEKRGISP